LISPDADDDLTVSEQI